MADSLPAIQGLPAIEGVDKLTGEDLAVLQYILQATQTVNTVRMRKIEESKIPIGTKNVNITVRDTPTELKLDYPWISFDLQNDGAGDVRVAINTREGLLDATPILSTEGFGLNMFYPVINRIYLQAHAAGTTAAVRIIGKVGRRYE